MILTNHPDEGQPMTLDRLRRAYIEFDDLDGTHVIRLAPRGLPDDDWTWCFATFKSRIEEALR